MAPGRFAPPAAALRWAPATLALAAAEVTAWQCGSLATGALALVACVAAAVTNRAQDHRPAAAVTAPEQVEPDAEELPETSGVEMLAPPSLAFLSDPFAIPPPIMADMQAVQPFVETLCGQINGIQSDVTEGVIGVVTGIEAINAISAAQREQIHASVIGAETIRSAAAIPGEIVARLEVMLADRDRAIEGNFAGLQKLADEFQELRTMVDVITQIADKAFFLSVNAAVEAHHQGAAGTAFGLIASEMRSLASQTADSARQVGQNINAFAERMHGQLAASMPTRRSETNHLGSLIAELGRAQASITESGTNLDRLIQNVEAGHRQMVGGLSDILGKLQFQDVMRQRLDQVFDALQALEDVIGRAKVGATPERSLLDVIEDQRQSYVMESQRNVYDLVVANDEVPTEPARKIELF